ncbi:MAG: hypothetical protein O9353_01920 [Bacteroidia bacterium]|jgi:hypothetical protein|nr:hypothetical protein [Bacteroidia bacterium]
MNLHEIIDEINHLQSPSKHKAALDIFNLLENNRRLFLEKLDQGDFNGLLSGFETLAYAHPKEYGTIAYDSDFDRLKGSLLYHLNKIL